MAVAMINDRTLCAPVYLVPAVSHNHFYSVNATQDHACYNSQYRAKLWSLMEFHDDEPCESGAPRKADQLWPAERAFSLVERSSNHSGPALPRREKTILQKLYQDDCSRVEKMMKADECGAVLPLVELWSSNIVFESCILIKIQICISMTSAEHLASKFLVKF